MLQLLTYETYFTILIKRETNILYIPILQLEFINYYKNKKKKNMKVHFINLQKMFKQF